MNNNHNEKGSEKTEKRKLGDKGESLVCMFLVKQGFEILDRNYLKPYGELDIIAIKDLKYHFIEVKSVSCEMEKLVSWQTSDRYRPEDNVHPWKLRKLGRVVQAYLLENHLYEEEWQFDVAVVYIDTEAGKSKIEYLDDIVL
jgi:putative endonuclease